MKMKKLVSMLLAVACVFSMAACGSKDESKDSGDAGSDASSEAVTAKVIDVDLTSEEYAFGVDKT